MGPRARRRLVVAGIAALIVAGGATAYAVTCSGGGGTDPTKEVYGTFGAFGVDSGSTPAQVRAKLGEPDRKRAGCWIYGVHGTSFHGSPVLPQISGIVAVRYCFLDGVVSVVEDHWRKVKGKDPFPTPWVGPLSFGCGGKPCTLPQ